MTDKDAIRLKWLLEHYGKPYTQNMKNLEAYRKNYPNGKLPDNSHRPDSDEWEGPFFCRIIEEFLTNFRHDSLNAIVSPEFKKQERGKDRR